MRFKLEGLREVQTALRKLPDAAAKTVVRNILRRRLKPVRDQAKSKAPRLDGDLQLSIRVGTRLTKRQKKLHRKVNRHDIEMFVGAGPHPQAHLQEFGTSRHPPQAFMRPAWDRNKATLFDGLADDMWKEIAKKAKQLANKRRAAALKSRFGR